MRDKTMKFLSGVLVGHVLTSFAVAYSLGYFHRGVAYGKWLSENDAKYDWREFLDYVTENKRSDRLQYGVTLSEEEHKLVTEKLVRASENMHSEGYSTFEIAEALGLSEEGVRSMLETKIKYYQVTMSESDHCAIQIAIQMLSGDGSDESFMANEALLANFLENTRPMP